jgi:hypothetical protein
MRRGVVAATAALVMTLGLAGPARAGFDADKPYILSTPFFDPKDGSTLQIRVVNLDNAIQQIRWRRWYGNGSPASDQQTNSLSPAAGLEFLPSVPVGADQRVEVWADSPGVSFEVEYTDDASVKRQVSAGDLIVVGPQQRTEPQRAADTLAAVQALTAPLDALGAKLIALGGSVDGYGPRFDALSGKIDSLNGSTVASDAGAAGKLDALAAANQKLTRSVSRLRKQLGSLRKLIVKRLPAR